MDKTQEKISEYVASFTLADLSEGAIHAVKRSLVDSVGCALGAFAAEPAKIGRRLAGRVTSNPPASIIGTTMKTSPEWAAFVNGTMVRYLDFNDDYINRDGPHPSDNISAVLAVSETVHASGKNLACGITMAYEIVDQLVDNADFMTRGWDYVTETSIGSALGSAKVLGLSKAKMAHALALAIAPNIGLQQTRIGELSHWKGCAGPNAARNGVFAALLASEGLTGPNQPFEGRCALWDKVTGKFEVGPFGGQGRRFKIEDTFFKPRPVMYPTLALIETALELRSKIDVNNIASIKVVPPWFIQEAPEFWDPRTRETADHSQPYIVVAMLVDGELSEKTYTPERYRDPQILALLKKLTMEKDPAYIKDFPKTFHARIEVVDNSGKKIVVERKDPKGHPANPMTDDEITEKFLKLTERTLTAVQAKAALDLMWHLEDIDDVAKIFDAVVV
jgi:2-methylcitrate dehydratase